MKIQVLNTFGRRRVMGSNKILPGIYDARDKQLYGLADELVELGVAVEVDRSTPVTEFKAPEPYKIPDFHNEVMKAMGRPVETEHAGVIESHPIDEAVGIGEPIPHAGTQAEAERDALLLEYETLTGKKPAQNIGMSTLKSRLAELRDTDATEHAND
jgi:hypothetical protein